MIKGLGLLAIGLAFFLSAGPARADYFLYTDRPTFEAALQSEKTDTFEELGPSAQNFTATGLSQANGLTQPITITQTGSFLFSGSASSIGFYPSNGTYIVGPRSFSATDGIVVTLPTNIYNGAGADVGNLGASGLVSFFGTTSQGESFSGSVMVTSSSLGFLGVTTNSPTDFVNSITFSAPVGANTDVVIDNVSFGTVPEPASMALLATGFLTAGFCAMRRRIRQARA